MKEVAFLLRNEILKHSKVTKLPESISIKDVIEGECTVPILLNTFYGNLVTTGEDRYKQGTISENKKRKIESLAHLALKAPPSCFGDEGIDWEKKGYRSSK